MPARTTTALTLVLLAAVLAACGSEPRRAKPLAPVRLTIDAPADPMTTDDGTVEVHGRVWPPDATVLVAGDEAGVDRGGFSAVVPLDEGANVIDVEAGAPRRAAAMTALRVNRRVPVTVPDLDGRSPEEAVAALQRLGLRAQVERGGGPFDSIFPSGLGVCGTDPGKGEALRRGSTVRV